MPYKYLEEVATADVAFEAWGSSLEELFISAADAAMNVMVDDIETIEKEQELSFEVSNPALDMLLYNFINELIYYKDAKKLLLRVSSVKINQTDSEYMLSANAYGEVLNPEKHPLSADVKAVTLHMFSLHHTDSGWKATMILDI
ncbi:MAG: archease [Deltaproteobacteria bacterium]|nr:archease [Deltaproteobacteria bacterium]